MATADNSTTPGLNCAHGGEVELGAWTKLTLTYNQTDQRIALYVDGVPVDSNPHTPVATSLFRGDFVLGASLAGTTASKYFNGSLSQVETWGKTLTPTQVDADAPPNGPLVIPSDSVPYPSGSRWSTGATTVTFNAGQLVVTSAGTPLFTKGTTGSPNAVLTMQSNGDLAAYKDAATAKAAAPNTYLWDTGTSGNPGDVLLLHPSGNLVMHSSDGVAMWLTNTGFPDAPGCDQWLLTQAAAGSDTALDNLTTPSGSITYTANHARTANAATVFDGSTSIERASGPAFDTTGSFTVSAWAKINNLDSTQTVLGQGTVNHQSFYLGYTTGSNGWVFQSTTTDTPTATTTATAGKWTHLTGVYDATTGALTLYVNGVAATTTGINTTPSTTPPDHSLSAPSPSSDPPPPTKTSTETSATSAPTPASP
ncbi:hypothetical protein GXP74_13675 [Streptacidiphilus sp. P02-A3a]|nr:hypothetical protein GXP74_13675 [Streptacidiphilus sp. P02-A3a]